MGIVRLFELGGRRGDKKSCASAIGAICFHTFVGVVSQALSDTHWVEKKLQKGDV